MSKEKSTNPSDDAKKFAQTLRDRVAQGIYDARVKMAREETAKLDLSADRIKKVFEKARGEADRSAAILMFALAEDLMIEAIERYCQTKLPGKHRWEDVKSVNGLLGTAQDRMTFLSSCAGLLKTFTPIFTECAKLGTSLLIMPMWTGLHPATKCAAY